MCSSLSPGACIDARRAVAAAALLRLLRADLCRDRSGSQLPQQLLPRAQNTIPSQGTPFFAFSCCCRCHRHRRRRYCRSSGGRTGRAIASHSGGIGAVLDAMRGSVRSADTISHGLVVIAAISLSSQVHHASQAYLIQGAPARNYNVVLNPLTPRNCLSVSQRGLDVRCVWI